MCGITAILSYSCYISARETIIKYIKLYMTVKENTGETYLQCLILQLSYVYRAPRVDN
jgi:hypothetical protein